MQWLKQSTVATVIVGPVLDSAGAEVTTLALADLNISKNGGTPAAVTSGTLTHVANGWYTLAFATGNVDTLGRLDITCTLATKQLPPKAFMVLPATVFDALITNATTSAGGLGDIQRMAGTVLTARDIGSSVLLSSGTGTGQVKLASGYVAPNWGDVGNPTAAVTLAGTVIGSLTLVATGGIVAGSFAAGAIDAAAIATDAIGSAEISAAAVTKIQAGLATPTNITAGTITTVTTVTNQLTAAAIATGVWQDATAGDFTTANSIGKSLYNSFTAGTSVFTVAALANAPTGGSAPSAATIASAVWQDTTAGDFTTALSVGKSLMNGVTLGTGLTVAAVTGLTASNLDATISSRMATYTQPTGFLATTFPSTIASTTNITAGTITTVTTLTGHTPQTGDSFARIGALGAGLTALATQASVNTIDDFLDTEIAAIQTAVVTTIPATIATIDTWVKRNAVILSGLISTAGTATEVFTISSLGVTATVTVDASGNRSNVVWS